VSSGRVLIVSYWFPPAGGIAVQRALSLTRYLPDLGFEVHVLTPKNPPAPALDPALLSRVPAEVKVHRVWNPMPQSSFRKRLWGLFSRRRAATAGAVQKNGVSGGRMAKLVRRVLCPDPEVVWVPFAIRRARGIIKKYGIDTVVVTAPPFSAFMVGNALKRWMPALRLVSDFRDEWLRFFLATFEFQQDPHIRQRAELIERATVHGSDAVVTVTPSLVGELSTRYADQPAAKFICVPNGYDPAAFADFHARPSGSAKVIVSYVGTVYSTTSPSCYFEALDSLPESLRSRVETRFVGRIASDQKELVESRPDVKSFGVTPQAVALRHMEETDYLLLIMTDPSHVPGKLYEYLATGKPVLAFAPKTSEVARTLAETGGGWCLEFDDQAGIRQCMEALASGELATRFHPNQEAIRYYERQRLAAEFAAVLRPVQT